MNLQDLVKQWDQLDTKKNLEGKEVLAAVKQNGYALQFVKEQTEEIALEAVKQDGYALEFVKKQTEEIALEAVKQNGLALQFVKKQTEEIVLAAVKQYGSALRYVKERTEEICLEAVKQNGYALQYITNQTEEICLAAVKKYGDALQFVDKKIIKKWRNSKNNCEGKTVEINTIKIAYKILNPEGKFFDKNTMQFFGSRLARKGYEIGDSYYFVTSEQVGHKERAYTIRKLDRITGVMDTIGDFGAYRTAKYADLAIRNERI